MNVKRKQAIDTLSAAVSNINDVKIQTDIQSLGELSEAFINTSDKAERKKLATDYKRALLAAALGGEYAEEEVRVDARGRKTIRRRVKKVAPNPSAALSYLQNKDKENWSPNPKADPELEDTSEIEEDIYGKDN